MSGTTWNPPSSPTVGELYQFAGATWSWNGSAWVNANTGEYFVTPAAMAAAIAAAPQVPQNYVDNSGFTVNQRVYASGTALAAGAYGFDRWKGGPAAGGTLTFSASPASTIVTISAGSIQQVIEGINMLSDLYTLSWSGNATGRIATTSGGGTYQASPIIFPGVANTNTFIEFTGGALGQVQLQLGSQATPWQPQPVAMEAVRCQRFYQTGNFQMQCAAIGGNGFWTYAYFNTTMRTVPSLGTNFSAVTNLATWGTAPLGAGGFALVGTSASANGTVGTSMYQGTFTASADL